MNSEESYQPVFIDALRGVALDFFVAQELFPHAQLEVHRDFLVLLENGGRFNFAPSSCHADALYALRNSVVTLPGLPSPNDMVLAMRAFLKAKLSSEFVIPDTTQAAIAIFYGVFAQ